MDLEIIILSEDRERQVSYDTTYMWKLKKHGTNELIYKAEIDLKQGRNLWAMPRHVLWLPFVCGKL